MTRKFIGESTSVAMWYISVSLQLRFVKMLALCMRNTHGCS